MSYESHLQSARDIVARCAIITLSDTRTTESDTAGQTILKLLAGDGHQAASYQIIPDDPAKLLHVLRPMLDEGAIDAILTTGGTGISQRDLMIDALAPLFDHALPGFGELFRMLSYDQIGGGAMMSRAIAGIARGKPIFAMPGSVKAVELAMQKLILPQLRHVLHELRK